MQLILRQFGGVPAATQIFDELNGIHHLLGVKVHEGLAIGEQGGLGGDDVEVAVNAELITVEGEVEIFLRGIDGNLLLLDFGLEDTQLDEIILHILKGG